MRKTSRTRRQDTEDRSRIGTATCLEEDLIDRIKDFGDMGMGGFHIHARYGLQLRYMGERYIQLMSRCFEEAKKRGMIMWLLRIDGRLELQGVLSQRNIASFPVGIFLWIKVPYETVEKSEDYPATPIRPLNWIGGDCRHVGLCISRYQVKLSSEGFL